MKTRTVIKGFHIMMFIMPIVSFVSLFFLPIEIRKTSGFSPFSFLLMASMMQIFIVPLVLLLGLRMSGWFKAEEELEKMSIKHSEQSKIYKAVRNEIQIRAVEKYLISDEELKKVIEDARKRPLEGRKN